MTAGKLVVVLSFVLVAAVVISPSLSNRARWPLLLLALVTGTLAVLRRQGVL
jgi:hypothetical protein